MVKSREWSVMPLTEMGASPYLGMEISKELARFYRVRIAAVIGHAEGIFHIGVFDDL